ncbi:MAG: SMP-30/gluconolactonase/LRE family protein [Sphingomicrobium sp.]
MGNRSRFVTLDPGDAYADGVTCDAEGGVWLGLWGGGQTRRYEASGVLTDVVRVPVANVTKVALGGADGHTGFIATARIGLDPGTLAAQPLAGDLFTFKARIGRG